MVRSQVTLESGIQDELVSTSDMTLVLQPQLHSTSVAFRMDQTPSAAQLPFRTRPFFDGLGPSDSPTPFGELINQILAKLLAEDPVAWHLDY